MKGYHPPSGLRRSLDFLIDPDWSPEQALAVIELLDDLRHRIEAHYERVLQQRLRDDRVTENDANITDPPF